MPTYICLARWTSKGIENIKESPSRLDAARTLFQSMGLILKDFYMVTGQYDFIFIAEAPLPEPPAVPLPPAFLSALLAIGAWRTTSGRSWRHRRI